MSPYYYSEMYLQHHGILGQKWGVRRFQNKDGSLTRAGEKRYGDSSRKVSVKPNGVFARLKKKDKRKAAPEYEQRSRDKEMRFAANEREFQLMYQKKANDDSLDYWSRSEYQSLADYFGQSAVSSERLAKANDKVYTFKPSKDEKRFDNASDALSKLKRFTEPPPDVSKTKPGSSERLRALEPNKLQKEVESISGDWYNSEPKSDRWKKIYKEANENGKKVSERDLAKAALLDMGYKATQENIDYLTNRHVICWD